ncbi:MAG: hypothetical protein MUF64_10250 [Polyangiaceae bacterium]|jgi:hypothetical protein|nr:hypothetical protein [Polyangiaceae bacterium]
MLRRVALPLVVALAVCAPRVARADGFLEEGSGYALLLGPNIGGSFHSKPGALLGAELSFVHFDDGIWFGFYGDILQDLGLKRARYSVGPEMGIGPFGIDVGYLRELSDEAPRQGYRIRGLLSAFLVSAYLGAGTLVQDQQKFHFREGGLLFKMPLAHFF